MKKLFFLFAMIICGTEYIKAQEKLIYHEIKTDDQGQILPWYNDDPGVSYDHVIGLVWDFWINMRTDINGIPYYFNHQVWDEPLNDKRGLGGDQLNMALSSWQLLYQYSGDEEVKQNMAFIADYYLSHSLSDPDHEWPNVPYPYNNLIYSGIYDGDMIIGKGFFQPDKAGAFGSELVNLYKLWSKEDYPNETHITYLKAAIEIANTLASHIIDGDYDHSPLPFKVHTKTNEVGPLREGNWGDQSIKNIGRSSYTTNWAGTLELFEKLIDLNHGKVALYREGYQKIIQWMKAYPMKNNRWGPFFEDIPGWSDTQINAMTWARFIMTHREDFPNWKSDVKSIIDWVNMELGNDTWKKYGVITIDEQTAYKAPGNSHTARQAADELMYYSLIGKRDVFPAKVRQLNWATYMVDHDGKNFYPTNAVWLTDGYGDYVRHYLRAMDAHPEIAPNENHILSTTSTVSEAKYDAEIDRFTDPTLDRDVSHQAIVFYRTYDKEGVEKIRLVEKPNEVLLDGEPIKELKKLTTQGYTWTSLSKGGFIEIKRTSGNQIIIK